MSLTLGYKIELDKIRMLLVEQGKGRELFFKEVKRICDEELNKIYKDNEKIKGLEFVEICNSFSIDENENIIAKDGYDIIEISRYTNKKPFEAWKRFIKVKRPDGKIITADWQEVLAYKLRNVDPKYVFNVTYDPTFTLEEMKMTIPSPSTLRLWLKDRYGSYIEMDTGIEVLKE